MQYLALIQARTSSTRLPNKVLYPIMGRSILDYMLERVAGAKRVDQVVVITSVGKNDDIIEQIAKDCGYECFRGDESNLLDRHYQAARHFGHQNILKIPSDCPLIDPRIIDDTIHFFEEGEFDFVSNLHPASYPDGNDVEIMSFNALEKAWKEASKDFEKEHTTPYIWENPDIFSIGNHVWSKGQDYSKSHRFTIDYFEDYLFIKAIYEKLYQKNKTFSLEDILHLLDENKSIFALNQKFAGEYWYRNHLDQLRTISKKDYKK